MSTEIVMLKIKSIELLLINKSQLTPQTTEPAVELRHEPGLRIFAIAIPSDVIEIVSVQFGLFAEAPLEIRCNCPDF